MFLVDRTPTLFSIFQLEVFFRENIDRPIRLINDYLHKTTYLVGHRITVADIILASVLVKIFEGPYGAAERSKVPNVVRYFETIVNQPAAKPIIGEVKYAEKAAQYVPPPKEKKESKPAHVAAAVKEKVAPKPKPKEPEDDDDDELAVKEEPKPKNPLDLLPKSTLNLEDWKRAYSNLDTRGPGGSLEWFYSK